MLESYDCYIIIYYSESWAVDSTVNEVSSWKQATKKKVKTECKCVQSKMY